MADEIAELVVKITGDASDLESTRNGVASELSKLEKELKEEELEEVMRTAEAYYRNGHSIVKASEEVFIHKNTLWYRMNKLFDVLAITECNDFEKELLVSMVLAEYRRKKGFRSLKK